MTAGDGFVATMRTIGRGIDLAARTVELGLALASLLRGKETRPSPTPWQQPIAPKPHIAEEFYGPCDCGCME